MKQNIRTSAIRTVWVGLMTGLGILCMAAINQKRAPVLTGIDVHIDGFEHGDVFLTEEDVRAGIYEELGTVENQLISQVDVTMLEQALHQNPFVRHVDVYVSSDGLLSVSIQQREPLMRVLAGNGETYYIDRAGMRIPVSPNFTARVVVVTGAVDALRSDSVATHKQLAGVHRLVRVLEEDVFLKALVEQVHIAHDGTITLIPKVGETVITFGDAERIRYKLASLKSFYTQVVGKGGWDQYETINLAYDGQIVCKRKES